MHIQPLFGSISPFLRKASTVFPPCLYCASTVFVEAQYTNRIGTVDISRSFPELRANKYRSRLLLFYTDNKWTASLVRFLVYTCGV